MHIRLFERIPYGYAAAYFDPAYDAWQFYPLGIHLLVRWHRRFWEWMSLVEHDDVELRMARARSEGYAAGWEDAWRRIETFKPSMTDEEFRQALEAK